MDDGEGWKRGAEMAERNSPEKVFLDEYNSIIEAYREHVLKPIIYKGGLDRDVVSLTKADLEWKINDPNFKKLPFKIKDAYQNFMGFMEVLEKATDEEIEACKNVLNGLLKLGFNCNIHGHLFGKMQQGRNPCRENQYETTSALKKAERKESSQLVKATKQMLETCKKCPYK